MIFTLDIDDYEFLNLWPEVLEVILQKETNKAKINSKIGTIFIRYLNGQNLPEMAK